jgi:predicted P-loop ATPase/GTPase
MTDKSCVVCGDTSAAKGSKNTCGVRCSEERLREQQRKYYIKNSEKLREQQRKYRAENLEKALETEAELQDKIRELVKQTHSPKPHHLSFLRNYGAGGSLD